MPGVLGGLGGSFCHIPCGARPRWSRGCQTAARGTSRRGKMSPSETIKLLNKTRCFCECSMFFSICLGSATLTSRPHRGAAEGTRWIVQETSALANFSALKKPGQGFNAFALQKNSPLSFPPSLSATLTHHRLPAQPGELPPARLLLQNADELNQVVSHPWTVCSLPPCRLDVKHQKVPCGNTT